MKFLIPQRNMKFRLVEPHNINVQNDIRSAGYLRVINPSKARETRWVAAGVLRKNRQAEIVEIPTHIPANTTLVIKSINKDFAVLEVISSPILTGSHTRDKKRIVLGLPELFKLKFRQE